MKPLPPTVTAEIVRLDPPVFDTVSACVWLLPTGMLPRFILEGALRYPGPPVPVPERAEVMMPEWLVLWPPQYARHETAMLPLLVPAVCGVKETDSVVPCRGAKVMGRLGPAKLNPVPDVVT